MEIKYVALRLAIVPRFINYKLPVINIYYQKKNHQCGGYYGLLMNFMYIMYRLQLENRNLFRLSLTMQKSLMLIATVRRKYLHMPLECI